MCICWIGFISLFLVIVLHSIDASMITSSVWSRRLIMHHDFGLMFHRGIMVDVQVDGLDPLEERIYVHKTMSLHRIAGYCF